MKSRSIPVGGILVTALLALAGCAMQQAKVNATTVETIPKPAAIAFLKKVPPAPQVWGINSCVVTDEGVIMGQKHIRYADMKASIEFHPIQQKSNINLAEKGLWPETCFFYRTPDGQQGKDTDTINKIGTALLSLGVEVDTQ